MESVELTGKSVEEAIQQALIRLGKSRDEVDIVVLNEGHKGILGFVRGESARVRATVRKPESAADRPPETRAAAPTRSAPTTRTAPRVRTRPPAESAPVAPAAESEAPPAPAAAPAAQTVSAATLAQLTLEELLDRMGIDADVVSRGGAGTEESPIMLDVEGEDLGILIGRRGETLSSMQFLINLMVGKQLDSWVRVLVDVEGYRARREESLRSMAARVADRVRRTGQPIALEPMPASERRIVHIALQDNPYVMTESSGYGEERRVTVMPKPR